MNDFEFQRCLDEQRQSNGKPFWKDLAYELGYSNPDALRKRFGREKKKRRYNDNHLPTLPKIFIMDIETSTILVRVFGLGVDGYIHHKSVEKDWFVLSWAGKWLHDSEILHDVVTPMEAINRDDLRVCESLWNIFEEADVIVAHNGDRFDIRKMVDRWQYHGILPPLPYRTYDTLKESRRYAKSTSHSLDFLARKFKIPKKLETEAELWEKCEKGDKVSLMRMNRYCQHDIEIGEQIYLKLRAWSKTGVNLALYVDGDTPRCPRCLSSKIDYSDKKFTTGANAYSTYRCLNPACGHTGRTKSAVITKEKRKSLLS